MVSLRGLSQAVVRPFSMRDVPRSIPDSPFAVFLFFFGNPFYSVKSSFYPLCLMIEEANTLGGNTFVNTM